MSGVKTDGLLGIFHWTQVESKQLFILLWHILVYSKYTFSINLESHISALKISFSGGGYGVSWRSVLLLEETEIPGENHRPVSSHWQTLSHNVVSSTHRLIGIQTQNLSGDRHFHMIKPEYLIALSPQYTSIKAYPYSVTQLFLLFKCMLTILIHQ